MYDGNYAWGVYCAGMILFLVCISEWIFAYCDRQIKKYMCIYFGYIIVFVTYYVRYLLLHDFIKWKFIYLVVPIYEKYNR